MECMEGANGRAAAAMRAPTEFRPDTSVRATSASIQSPGRLPECSGGSAGLSVVRLLSVGASQCHAFSPPSRLVFEGGDSSR